MRQTEGVGIRYGFHEGLQRPAHAPLACAKELCWSMYPLADLGPYTLNCAGCTDRKRTHPFLSAASTPN